MTDGFITATGAVVLEAGATLAVALKRTASGKLTAAQFTRPAEPLTVQVEAGETVENGDYVLVEGANLTVNDLTGFTLVKAGEGWSSMNAVLDVKNGDLVCTVSGSSYGAPYLCYRGASTASEWRGAAHWQPKDGGTSVAWIDAANAVFDSTSNGVVVPELITLNDILVTGPST